MIHQRVFYFIPELIFVLNRHKDTRIYRFLLRDYVKLSKHIYFCEIVYFKTFLKNKTKENVDLAKVIGFKNSK